MGVADMLSRCGGPRAEEVEEVGEVGVEAVGEEVRKEVREVGLMLGLGLGLSEASSSEAAGDDDEVVVEMEVAVRCRRPLLSFSSWDTPNLYLRRGVFMCVCLCV